MLLIIGEFKPEEISQQEFATGVPFAVEFDQGRKVRFYEVKEEIAA
jgi:bisphosphoglycerate-dependent phosphoglycerate mutase